MLNNKVLKQSVLNNYKNNSVITGKTTYNDTINCKQAKQIFARQSSHTNKS